MEMKCKACGKVLNAPLESGAKPVGHYIYSEEAYCVECWEIGRNSDPIELYPNSSK
jgi:recombinational DNA repair protein (RecF pathway)